jgi:hypothetical protein
VVIDQPEIWKLSRYDSALNAVVDKDTDTKDKEFSANQGSRKNLKEPTKRDTYLTPEYTPERFIEDTDHTLTTSKRSVE